MFGACEVGVKGGVLVTSFLNSVSIQVMPWILANGACAKWWVVWLIFASWDRRSIIFCLLVIYFVCYVIGVGEYVIRFICDAV